MHRFNIALISRALAYMMVSGVFLYLINNYLVFWQELPGIFELFSHYGYFGFEQPNNPLEDHQIIQGWLQLGVYLFILFLSVAYTYKTQSRSMRDDSLRLARLAAYIIRFSFWWVSPFHGGARRLAAAGQHPSS